MEYNWSNAFHSEIVVPGTSAVDVPFLTGESLMTVIRSAIASSRLATAHGRSHVFPNGIVLGYHTAPFAVYSIAFWASHPRDGRDPLGPHASRVLEFSQSSSRLVTHGRLSQVWGANNLVDEQDEHARCVRSQGCDFRGVRSRQSNR